MSIDAGNERPSYADNQVVSTDAYTRNGAFGNEQAEDAGNAVIADQSDGDGDGVVLGQPIQLTAAGTAGQRLLSITDTAPHPPAGWWQRKLGNLSPGASNPGLADVPFEDDQTNVYQVAVKHGEVPTAATALLSSTYRYHTHRPSLGEQLTPASVVVNASTLEIRLPASNSVTPWADVTKTRKVSVWLVSPATADPNYIVHTADATSDGVNIDLVVPHHFGQSTPSTTASDYVLHVHGLSINRVDNLRAQPDGDGLQQYLVLCDYDSAAGTFDYTEQVKADSLRILTAKVNTMAVWDAALRAGAYIGTPETTRAWNIPSTWTEDDTVDPRTITFTNWKTATDHFVATGDFQNGLEPRLCEGVSSLVASFPAAAATGRYAIVMIAVEDGILSHTYNTEMTVVLESSLTADQQRRMLVIGAFDYDGTQPPGSRITNQSWVDINTRRGFIDPRAVGSGASDLALAAEEIYAADADGDLLKVVARLLPSTSTDSTYGEAFRVHRTSNTNTRTQVGRGADLTDGETAESVLGGAANDYTDQAKRTGSDRTWHRYAAGSEVARHERASGGAASGGAGRTMVEDVHLLGYKQVFVQDPIHAAVGDTRAALGDHVVLLSDTTLGNTTGNAPAVLSDPLKDLEGQTLRVGDVIRVTMLMECHDYTTGSTTLTIGFGVGGATIWTGTGDPGGTGVFAWVQADILITAVGSSGTYRATIRRTTSDGSDNLWNSGGAGTHTGFIYTSATGAIDTQAGGNLYAYGSNGGAPGDAGVTLRQFTVEHLRAQDGWFYDPSVRAWKCILGDDRKLRIPLDSIRRAVSGSARDGKIDQVTVWCGEDGGASDELTVEWLKVNRTTGTATVVDSDTQTGTGSAITLAPGTPLDLADDEYCEIQLSTVHGSDGTEPEFFVRSVRHRERVYELR